MDALLKLMIIFVFWYPVTMSIVWVVGGIIFYFRVDRKKPLSLTETPMVSLIVPCYNEEKTIRYTMERLDNINYPDYEIIAVNDGSSDNTSEILRELSEKYERLRVIDLKKNEGKANALYLGLLASKSEFLVCIDADAYLEPDAINYMIPHFITPNNGERVGAVTGNPRVRNRSSLIAKIQLCEYASIVSLIKRTQRILGKVMTVSGVVVAYRKRALLDAGLWDKDVIAEDIGVTWKLEKRYWDIRYEPRAICWMLVPETIKGIWNQRVRWAQGGLEVMFRHYDIFKDWRNRRLFFVFLEQFSSVLWAVSWFVLTVLAFINIALGLQDFMPYYWRSQFLSLICLIQFFVAIRLDSKYDEDIKQCYVWSIWYPVFYWYINAIIVLRAIPKALFKKKGNAKWESPDRGLGQDG